MGPPFNIYIEVDAHPLPLGTLVFGMQTPNNNSCSRLTHARNHSGFHMKRNTQRSSTIEGARRRGPGTGDGACGAVWVGAWDNRESRRYCRLCVGLQLVSDIARDINRLQP